MTTDQQAFRPSVDVDELDSASKRPSALEAEMQGLRAANIALREQLALRDHALDATSTFFVITRQVAPEPVIIYCNQAMADQHGFAREELLGKSIRLLTQMRRHNPDHFPGVLAAVRAGRTYNYEDEVTRR